MCTSSGFSNTKLATFRPPWYPAHRSWAAGRRHLLWDKIWREHLEAQIASDAPGAEPEHATDDCSYNVQFIILTILIIVRIIIGIIVIVFGCTSGVWLKKLQRASSVVETSSNQAAVLVDLHA